MTTPPHPALVEDSVQELYEEAPCGYLSCYPDGRIARVNRTFLSWTGYQSSALVGTRRFVELLTAGGRIYHETHYLPLLRMQGEVRAIAVDLVRADGSTMPVLVSSRLHRDADGREVAVRTTVFDASDRKAYEVELLDARRRAEAVAEWLRALEQVVADLAASPAVGDVTRVLADAGTAVLGAVSSAVWLTEPGRPLLRWSGGAGVVGDPEDLPAAPPGSGQDVVTVPVSGDAASTTLHRVLGGGDGPVLVVPLAVGDEVAGVLALRLPPGTGDVGPTGDRFTQLRTLGHQVGLALARARLADEQRRVAVTLQTSMLPEVLPADPRLALSACYRPGVAGLAVGGDWYDAFLVDVDRVAVVVGDVVGRGLAAAAAMGQLRSAVRALATTGSGPAAVLEHLDRFVEGFPAAQTATLVYGELDLRSGALRYACAGHPPPILVDHTGVTRLLWDGRSVPLGAHLVPAPRAEATVRLAPGDRVALYTDGVVERRHQSLDDGIDALAQALAALAERPMAHYAEDVVGQVPADALADDDVCLLALAFQRPAG